MPLGYALLALALVATVGANVLFAIARDRQTFLNWARRCVNLAAASVIGASVYLMLLIATHQFQVAYVAEYSAQRSSSWFLFAAFWGGQEGSILLWAFWTAVLGVVLSYRSGQRTQKVWPFYGIAQIYLLGLLLLKCPFALGKGPIPADGRGLNPLLENYWMVIHPPVLFLGFASTLIPAVWGLYGLVHKDWDGWAKASFSWTLFSFASLGFGLSLGGYWAYETLGWGGFWAWDPVENTSLVPWLFLIALLHGLPSQLKNGAQRKSNLLIAFLPFAFMAYGTFLTRTGILTDFSVHSFSSLGNDGFWVILGMVLVATFVPLGLWLWRLREIPKPTVVVETVAEGETGSGAPTTLNRTAGYALATLILAGIGLFVAVGMSMPLISKLWTTKGAAADADFYNKVAYVFGGLLMTLAMAVTPYLAWRSNEFDALKKRLTGAYIGAMAATFVMVAAAWYMGLRKPAMVLLFAASAFAAIANLQLIAPRLKHAKTRKTVGGFVAHSGAAMTLAGIAILVAFSHIEERILLVKNAPRTVMGYKMTYLGMTDQPYDRANNSIRIRMEKNGVAWEARPRYYFAPWAGKDTLFANPPAIHRNLLGDLYIACNSNPLSFYLAFTETDAQGTRYNASLIPAADQAYLLTALGPDALHMPASLGPNAGFALKADTPTTLGPYTFTLLGVKLDDAAEAAFNEAKRTGNQSVVEKLPQVRATAMLHVVFNGQESFVKPTIRQEKAGGIYSEIALLPVAPGQKPVAIRYVPPKTDEPEPNPDQVFETFNAPDPTEAVFLDMSTKPFIWLVWLGSLLYTLGGLIAYRRRAVELAKEG